MPNSDEARAAILVSGGTRIAVNVVVYYLDHGALGHVYGSLPNS